MEYYLVDKFNRGYIKHEPVVQHVVQPAVQPVVQRDGLELVGNIWNAKRRKISNVEKGTLFGDVVTFDQALTSDNEIWNAKRRKIGNVEKGSLFGDVVTFDQALTSNNGQDFEFNGRKYLLIPKGSDFDMNKRKFINLSEGVEEGDAVTAGQLLRYLENIRARLRSIEELSKLYTITKTYFSAMSRRIVNVKPGLDNNDVVTKGQLDAVKNKCDKVEKKLDKLLKGIEVTDSCIKIKDQRRICDLGKGVGGNDAATLAQLEEFNQMMVSYQDQINRILARLASSKDLNKNE